MVLDADVPGYFRNTEFSEELTFMNSFISYLLMCNMATTKTANQLQLYAINWNPTFNLILLKNSYNYPKFTWKYPQPVINYARLI